MSRADVVIVEGLDEDVGLLGLTGQSTIGLGAWYELECLLQNPSVTAVELVGRRLAIEWRGKGRARSFHGVVQQATESLDPLGPGERLFTLRLVPRSHRMELVTLQQVHLNRSIPSIVADKLKLCGVDFAARLVNAYPEEEFVVQYRETDAAFVSRLTEKWGISLFHEPSSEGERLIVTDDNSGFSPIGPIPYLTQDGPGVTAFAVSARMVPSVYLSSDYNYRTPQIHVVGQTENPHGSGGILMDFAEHHKTVAAAKWGAQRRAEEHEAMRVTYEGRSHRAELFAGGVMTLTDHPFLAEEQYLLTTVRHELSRGSGRVTPRPRMAGIMSGIVEAAPGSDGARPWIDDQGRYRVRLLFDFADHGVQASRAMRMAQAHAGPGIGTHFPLRPGVEVLMAFIDGDVDRPIIIGAVPNALTPTPVADRDAMRHRIRTTSGVLIEIEDNV